MSLFLVAHGVAIAYLGTIGGFGEFLNSKGFVIGGMLAWTITIVEILGGTAMALNYLLDGLVQFLLLN